MASVMSDLQAGRAAPSAGNAICKAASRWLRIIENCNTKISMK